MKLGTMILGCILFLMPLQLLAESEVDFDKKIITATVENAINAINQRDFQTFMSIWASNTDIAMVDPVTHQLMNGKEAIVQYLLQLKARKNAVYEVSDIKVTVTYKDQFAWVSCLVTHKYVEEGKVTRLVAKPMMLRFGKEDDIWKLTIAIASFTGEIQ